MQENADSLSDRFQPEIFRAYVGQWHEEGVGCIVHRPEAACVCHLAAEEHIQRVHHKSGVEVEVGKREEVVGALHVQSCFFLHFADDAFLAGLKHVYETARQVQRAFGWLFATATHKQFPAFVEDKGYRGRRGVEVVGESAVGTVFGLAVVYLKARRAALGAKAELGKRVFHNL